MPTVACIPPTSIAETTEEAIAGTSIEGLLAWANTRGKWWVKPLSGRFETAEDIEGSLIARNPDEVVTATAKFPEVGVNHLVFDLRLSFDRWMENIDLLGAGVIPACDDQVIRAGADHSLEDGLRGYPHLIQTCPPIESDWRP